ncbi:MAG: hypothetical protein Q8916_10495 [Bacteroidota bacterium]|nr:hypothetical protein [Bacteroidota bacterium]MDP4230817.1 hypothetical protein [Bacteroidota bacterium]MDP4236760.1 hypothetical protein [Bacteroidota bacterium]
MRSIVISALLLSVVIGCSDSDPNATKLAKLQAEIDSLNKKIVQLQPGLGEVMSAIQMHHAKLWFSATNENWKLAAFEIGEIKEQLEAAEHLASTRPEIASLPMIYPPVDSITHTIDAHDLAGFRGAFEYLTYTCNKCHETNKFEFNVIAIPTALPVVNQIFKLSK